MDIQAIHNNVAPMVIQPMVEPKQIIREDEQKDKVEQIETVQPKDENYAQYQGLGQFVDVQV